MNVQVARYGNEPHRITFSDGRPAIEMKEHDVADVVGRIVSLIKTLGPAQVNLNDNLVGAGIADRLRQGGYAVNKPLLLGKDRGRHLLELGAIEVELAKVEKIRSELRHHRWRKSRRKVASDTARLDF